MTELSKAIAATQSRVDNLTEETIPPRSQFAAEVARLSDAVDELSENQQTLLRAIEASPEKALAVPMLSAQVSDLEDDVTATRADLFEAIDRQAEQFRWFYGIVLGTVVATVATAIAAALQARRRSELRIAEVESVPQRAQNVP